MIYKMLKLNRKGQTLVEYVLIISLITVVAIAAVKILGGHLKDKITEVSCGMLNKEYIAGEKAGEGYCEGEESKLLD